MCLPPLSFESLALLTSVCSLIHPGLAALCPGLLFGVRPQGPLRTNEKVSTSSCSQTRKRTVLCNALENTLYAVICDRATPHGPAEHYGTKSLLIKGQIYTQPTPRDYTCRPCAEAMLIFSVLFQKNDRCEHGPARAGVFIQATRQQRRSSQGRADALVAERRILREKVPPVKRLSLKCVLNKSRINAASINILALVHEQTCF
ncbi:hypothetical protein PAPHI01_0044 [Pancytospora philotis]|nr:hypothetical protein PAPHI01_0044 [Pancytospora philotis]